ncbi:MAG TPA: R3H domain-containing nucleic acid-binding protein [Candidatus Paceibacterota bacterium]|nr:R3H domain-containing nucleic acid-binding protein [Candidatus Paceibacterota bacterium]
MNESIIAVLTGLLDSMGASYERVTEGSIAGQPLLRIETSDPSALIGTRGETLLALDHLLKRLVEQRDIRTERFILDVNEYQASRIREIEMRAKMMAERARSFAYDVELPPMRPYERLIVHSTLADEPHVKTESQGEGKERRVVIRYVAE